jgi:hypothetical protein
VQSGINQGASPGQGWAGSVSPYVKSIQLFHCPDDSTTGGSYDGYNYYPVSYGMNEYIANQTLASSTAPASTVLASETSGALAYLEYVDEGVSEVPGTYITLSPSTSGFPYHGCGSNCGGFDPSGQGGPDIYSGASKDNSGPVTALNAGSNAINATGGPQARHDPQTAPISGGSEYLLADGHVKYLRIQYVSSGYYPNSIPNLGTLVATYDPFDYNIPNHGY